MKLFILKVLFLSGLIVGARPNELKADILAETCKDYTSSSALKKYAFSEKAILPFFSDLHGSYPRVLMVSVEYDCNTKSVNAERVDTSTRPITTLKSKASVEFDQKDMLRIRFKIGTDNYDYQIQPAIVTTENGKRVIAMVKDVFTGIAGGSIRVNEKYERESDGERRDLSDGNASLGLQLLYPSSFKLDNVMFDEENKLKKLFVIQKDYREFFNALAEASK